PGSWGPARPPGPRLSEEDSKAAGEVLTAKQAPHRPGTAPTLGLRARRVAVLIICRTVPVKHSYKGSLMTPVEVEAPTESADPGARPPETSGAPPMREVRHEYTHTLPRQLSQLGVSLLVSTYQAGKVVAVGVAQEPVGPCFTH